MIEVKSIQRSHLNTAVGLIVVLIFNPCLSQLVELLQRIEVLMQYQKTIPEASEKAFNLALGGTIANGCMG